MYTGGAGLDARLSHEVFASSRFDMETGYLGTPDWYMHIQDTRCSRKISPELSVNEGTLQGCIATYSSLSVYLTKRGLCGVFSAQLQCSKI
jgi:hypothetical protein